MGTTYYYEGELPLGDKEETGNVGLFVSDYFGGHELYLRFDEDVDKTVRLDEKQAKAFLEGLRNAMRYLRYLAEQ